MVLPKVVWHGNQSESFALIDAIQHNCECKFGPMSVRTSSCRSHDMLVHDQKALDGLLFYRHIVQRLLREEWLIADERI